MEIILIVLFLVSIAYTWHVRNTVMYRAEDTFKALREAEQRLAEKDKDIVECLDCSCLLNRTSAQCVTACGILGETYAYYCGTHRKPYKRIVYPLCYGNFTNSIRYYANNVEVTKDGTPITPKKK